MRRGILRSCGRHRRGAQHRLQKTASRAVQYARGGISEGRNARRGARGLSKAGMKGEQRGADFRIFPTWAPAAVQCTGPRAAPAPGDQKWMPPAPGLASHWQSDQ
eukprot:923643-Prorocentrum_minimum.AAC.1